MIDPRIVIGAKYADKSFRDTFTVVEIDLTDDTVELDNGQWYSSHGDNGFIAKLDAGIIKRIPDSAA